MKIYEIGTGYTSIPAKMGAATEIVVEEMTKALIENGQDVTILDIKDPNRKANNLPIEEIAVPSIFTRTDVALGIMHKLKRVVYSIALARRLCKIIKKSNEEIVLHFHNQYNMFFFMKLASEKIRKKVKIAYTVHSYIWPKEWSEIEDTIKKKYFQEVACVKEADYTLVLNEKTKEHFINHLGVSPNRIFMIKNGVNTNTYRPLDNQANEQFKQSVGLKDKRYLFQVGSVCDRKNQLGAVKLLKQYLQQNKNIAYVYAGGIIDDEYQQQIKQYATDNGIAEQIIYAGELAPGEMLNRYYSAANASIFPSKQEAFGLVIIEAISAGATVLLEENFVLDLNSGFRIYTEDTFNQYVTELLDNKIVNEEGRQEVINKYSWNAVAKEHLDIFTNN